MSVTYSSKIGKLLNSVVTKLGAKEDTSNKVTSISSSSTDTQYPSAKCVYDEIDEINSTLLHIVNIATDFNNLINYKFCIVTVTGCANNPTPSAGGILCSLNASDDEIKQFYINDGGELFERYYQNNSWSVWHDALSEQVISRTFSFTTNSSAPYAWSCNIGVNGYTPVTWSLLHGYSGTVTIAAEAISNNYISGFCNTGNLSVTAYIVYVKN